MKISLQGLHAQMVEDGDFSHNWDYIIILLDIWNHEGHQNHITGSRVTAVLLNGWILPIGIAFSGWGSVIKGATC